MNDQLPDGWVRTSIGECVDILDGKRIPVNSDERAKRLGDVPYYGATGQVGWIDDYIFNEPLILLGEDGAPFLDKSKEIAYLISGKSWVNNHAHVLRAVPGLTTNEFIKYTLDGFDFHEHVNGTTRLKLTQGAMVTIPVHLPPLAEQRRIVTKVESLLSEVNAAHDRLAKLPAILKCFRKSVLAAACSGQLTAEWREEHAEAEVWKTVRLRDVGNVTGGITKNPSRLSFSKQVPYLRVANVYENRLELADVLEIGVTA